MRHTNPSKPALVWYSTLAWLLIIAVTPALGSVRVQLRDGRPVVDGVYVNGQGPYRFLLDTGSNVNLIDARLARKINLPTTAQVQLASAAGSQSADQSDGNEVALDTAKAANQRFLVSSLDAIHNSMPDVEGVLGCWFLVRFDYALDLDARQLTFGTLPESTDARIRRVQFQMVNARPVISTSLGNLAVDSGQGRLVLFGAQPDDLRASYELRTVSGAQFAGKATRSVLISGKRVWSGDAVAIPTHPEAGVDGLLPVNLLHFLYVCNSGGYMMLR